MQANGGRELQVIAIDWSGARQGARKKIWLAEAAGDQLLRLESGRERREVADHLIELAHGNSKLIVGLDFAFSLPTWFFDENSLSSVDDVWALAEREGEDWLASCKPPFWGKPGTKRPDLPNAFRRTELELPELSGIRPKSVFQVGGAGAVGTGSIRGMPVLRRLRNTGFSIWPFDPPGWPTLIEIWPRVLTGAVTKSSWDERLEYLDTRYPSLGQQFASSAAQSEDAFDAAVSALVMAAHAEELSHLPPVSNTQARLEGVIWHPGVTESTLAGR